MLLRTAPLLAAALTALAAIAATPPSASTRDGVYTAAQAEAGARLYATRCAMCHGRALEGTFEIPGLGDRFMAHWSNAPLSNLHEYVGRAMPQFAPGSLTPDDTTNIIAFLLQANGLPAGSAALPSEAGALARITVQPADLKLTARAVPRTQ
ncbi:c-type cytochrome [Sphingobium sp. B11D3D]|uniref:c-type cytochrome n=1 Tax=Sphingobium sp. B11D3D TaxID=2940576 RepID=UPI0022255BD6|nr:cytochrome c [Sphingobium sp. B11D3D]MCW2370574.1 mono/diheme cytochrome c family protein [Sphingobium sp. B11D3D]